MKFKKFFLFFVILIIHASLSAMNIPSHDNNPILSIDNHIHVNNYTDRDLEVYIIPNKKCMQWIIEKKTSHSIDKKLEKFGYTKLCEKDLQDIEKKDVIKSKQVKQFSFSHFLLDHSALIKGFSKNDMSFSETEEQTILIKDSNNMLAVRVDVFEDDQKYLITQTEPDIAEKINLPASINFINFTLELKDGPKKQLEDSYFFATIVE